LASGTRTAPDAAHDTGLNRIFFNKDSRLQVLSPTQITR
jgi:hypothetical protein